MQLNKNQVIEVNLKDLFFHIVYRWRSILLVALIGAVVLCGYQYLSIKSVHDQGKLTKEERQYQIDLQQYSEQLESSKNTIKVYSKLIQEQNAYLNNSIYMQLSPQSVWVASSKYLVKPDQEAVAATSSAIDPADSILPLYAAPLSKVTDEEKLKEAFGTEKTEYINELVITSTNVEDNTVTIFVLGESKESVQAGLDLLNEQMDTITNDKAGVITPHQLIRVSDSISRGLDKEMSSKIDLAAKQETLAKTTEENQKTLQEARQKLDALEASGKPVAPGQHLVKMGVIGFVLGAGILTFLYIISYVLRGTLNSSRELTERYRIPILGTFATAGFLHSGKGLDKFFSRWELGKDALDQNTVYDNISALIEEKQEAKNILVISTLPAEKLTTFRDALAERISEKTITAQADVVRNSEAITEASKADAVVIAEAKGVSLLKDMDRMAENLIISEANVIGAVVL